MTARTRTAYPDRAPPSNPLLRQRSEESLDSLPPGSSASPGRQRCSGGNTDCTREVNQARGTVDGWPPGGSNSVVLSGARQSAGDEDLGADHRCHDSDCWPGRKEGSPAERQAQPPTSGCPHRLQQRAGSGDAECRSISTRRCRSDVSANTGGKLARLS